MNLKEEIQKLIEGDVENSEEILKEYSHDTSLFEVKPEVVVFPKNREDIKKLIKFVNEQKKEGNRDISITGRSAGTDMTGGPLNESIILSTTRYLNSVDVDEDNLEAVVEPGLYYRDFEKEILPEHITLPTYPASKTLAALGGMIMNNCAGERTLRYGQMREFVKSVKIILSDGNEYTFGPLTEDELRAKCAERTFEGGLYRNMWELVRNNREEIEKNRPQVSKNSSGYALWRVWDENTKLFNLAHLFVGSQGTLGILSEAKLRLLNERTHKRMIVTFFKNWKEMPEFVNKILPFDPESLEAFDDATLKLGIRFMPEIAKKAGMSFAKFAFKFFPEVGIGIRMFGLPKLIVIIELAEDTEETINQKQKEIEEILKKGKFKYRVLSNKEEEDKYWTMRRESFNLLRQHVHGSRTAPFIEDFCIKPEYVPEFLPQVNDLLKKNGIKINITGHAGNGNFHIIPLMDLTKESEREKIVRVADEFYELVHQYGGSISAEHNDGILRTPYMKAMFSNRMLELFHEVKHIFDPQNIFNPGKKMSITREYLESHIAGK